MMQSAQSILQDVFGYSAFRPTQQQIIDHVLSGQHTLAIMPTGGGKSLCYQIPALLFDGVTLVISPLISLMQDQVRQLRDLNLPVCELNSSLSAAEYSSNLQAIQQGSVKMVFLAPETLLQESILNTFQQAHIACIAIDEAHCISEWGHDFRPEYRQLGQVASLFPQAIRIGLTATATPRVREDIRQQLGVNNDGEFVASFDRPNLFIEVLPKESPWHQCLQFLQQRQGQSGIIYCQSRSQVDELTQRLQGQGFKAESYHAGLSSQQRSQNQDAFIRDDIHIMVATVAFGMGINKPDVRFVLNYDLPKNIESYYQQIGRAGRDGEPAHCTLLFGYGDTGKVRFFIDQISSDQERRMATLHLDQMLSFAETEDCRRVALLQYFGETPQQSTCEHCDNCTGQQQEKEDLTTAAQKFLSCVYRTRSRFGASHIVDILRGSKAAKVIQNDHHLLSTYNIGLEYSKKQWTALARQLIRQGLLSQDQQFGSLRLTEKAAAVLKGQATFLGRLQEEQSPQRQVETLDEDVDQGLFDILRTERKTIADEAGLPPYTVFADKSLKQMASFFPQSETSLLQIHGVGASKLEKYGATFIALIQEYCQTHDIQEVANQQKASSAQIAPPPKASPKGESIAADIASGAAVASADGLEALAEQHKIKPKTLIDHLYRYVQAGNTLQQAETLLAWVSLPDDRIEQVMHSFNQQGAERLKPVFEAMQELVSYDDLQVLRVYYMSLRG